MEDEEDVKRAEAEIAENEREKREEDVRNEELRIKEEEWRERLKLKRFIEMQEEMEKMQQ